MSAPRGEPPSNNDALPILRPKPQRHWQITPMSTEPPTPRSPSTEPPTNGGSVDDGKPVPRSRSILNLTASTLFGIYASPTSDSASSFQDFSLPQTPWGTGALTPASPETPRDSLSEEQQRPLWAAAERVRLQQPPYDARRREYRGREPSAGAHARNVVILLILGVVYGGVVAQLHDDAPRVIPIRSEVLQRHAGWHVGFWGLAAVLAGWVLPRLDRWWAARQVRNARARAAATARGANGWSSPPKLSTVWEGEKRGGGGCEAIPEERPIGVGEVEEMEHPGGWIGVSRTLGVFLGIAFVIRRLPWESTLQTSLTLALSNPVLWYLVDGSATGLLLSATASVAGAAAVVGCGPEVVAWAHLSSNATATGPNFRGSGSAALGGAGSAAAAGRGSGRDGWWAAGASESVAVCTWVASALFYSVVCFGNIGRMLVKRSR